MHVIGLDIGGANLKAADNDGAAVSRSFPLWREPQRLVAELSSLLRTVGQAFQPDASDRDASNAQDKPGQAGKPDVLAVTMTAELCDCFATKAEGVDFILRAVEEVANGTEILVWQTGAEFVTPDVAREIPLLVAAANWHALATFCGRMVTRGSGLLIDVGSTTTDIIPLLDGAPVACGMTDRQRLEAGELVYTGVRRTPVCALAREIRIDIGEAWLGSTNGSPQHSQRPEAPRRSDPSHPSDSNRRLTRCSLAAELFATTLDVHLLRGDIPENPQDCDTANGKPATRAAAIDRLARMVCCDRTELTDAEITSIADQLAEIQQSAIAAAVERVIQELPSSCRTAITSGSGEFLAGRVADCVSPLNTAERISLPQILGPEIASVACAYAVANLAAEQIA